MASFFETDFSSDSHITMSDSAQEVGQPGAVTGTGTGTGSGSGTGTGTAKTPETRKEFLSSGTTMDARKKRPRPTTDPEDENQRKLQRAIRWHLFLFHRNIPAMEKALIQGALGEVAADSHEYLDARRQCLDNQKNFKSNLLTKMVSLVKAHAEEHKLLDIEVTLSATRKAAIVKEAWSPQNFFHMWSYIKGYIDYEKSSALGQYYMRNMFIGLAGEILDYLDVQLRTPKEAEARKKKLHSFYFDMPAVPQFGAIDKKCFHEVFEHGRNQKRQKVTNDTTAKSHERFLIEDEPPPPPESVTPPPE
ncbi:hypothetical protein GGR56DRAFT_686679 [Xylariaceae sp. FL0804]|nr:hypothetical protein GGR56DRAFT_686679 [Xylariaceae sp. FL0804]